MVDVRLPCIAELRCLPGGLGVHFVLSDMDAVRLRAEAPANPGEVVPFHIDVDDKGAPHVWSDGFRILLLPVDDRYDAARPILPAAADASLDIAIVIDGTLRNWNGGGSPRLLDQKDLWGAHVDALMDFITRLVDGRDARAAVIAFGDQDPPAVTAADLRPRYRLSPVDEQLQTSGVGRLRERLLALEATPGADFVDALADALNACVRLRWRKESRKIVVVSGDSPGHSLLFPLPKGADLGVRHLDVDTQALALHRLGIEIVTIYHDPPAEKKVGFARELLSGAKAQYVRLASMPELAFEAAALHPAAAERVGSISSAVARGMTLGELVRIVESKKPVTVAGAT
jgi:hypothetical protein